MYTSNGHPGGAQMMTPPYTPTPWSISKSQSPVYGSEGTAQDIGVINQSNYEQSQQFAGHICTSLPPDHYYINQANTAHSVHCVNVHEQLVHALDAARESLENSVRGGSGRHAIDALTIVHHALKLALD